MNRRRLPLFLLLVLIPVPAHAHKHFTECFTGVAPEKQEALALRVSCGLRLWGEKPEVVAATDAATGDEGQGANPGGTGTGPTQGATGGEYRKRSLFVVGELAEYVVGRDSGRSLDGWMVGLRYRLGDGGIEPFVHALGGRQRPSRTSGSNDAATPWSGVLAAGGGFDIEIDPFQDEGLVTPIRLQFDVVESGATSGFHPYARATFGVSFRYEKPGK